MTEITVKTETDSGAAVIEIRGLTTKDSRFRLYDISADKYLTRRGWTKTPSALPVEAVLGDELITIPLDPDLARKISSRASLSLEQPSSELREIFLWPEHGAALVAAPPLPPLEEPIAVEAALADLGAAGPEPKTSEAKPHIDPKEPVKDNPAAETQRQEPRPSAAAIAELYPDEAPRQSWLPTAVAAALFLVLGFGLAYLWFGSGREAAVQEVTQAAAEQRTKDQADFARKLEQAQAASKESAAKAAEAGSKAADLAAARDAARKSAKEKDDLARDLQTKLNAANTEIESFKATGQKVDARIADLTRETQALAAERDSAFKTIAEKDAAVKDLEARLAEREKALRDIQSKLEVADVQIDALKTMASKNSEANLAKTALEDKVAQLTADLDSATKSANDKQAQIKALEEKLSATEAKLASASTAPPAEDESQVASADEPAESGDTNAQLQQERDLYARELKTLTDSFATLKAQKEALEKQVATLKTTAPQPGDEPTAAAEAEQSAPATVWGATAIDDSGAIFAVSNQLSKKAAINGAAAKCRTESGFGCQPLMSFQNKCFSVARFEDEGPATDNYAFSVHANWRRSAAEALGRCERMGQKCTVRFTACSPNNLSKQVSE